MPRLQKGQNVIHGIQTYYFTAKKVDDGTDTDLNDKNSENAYWQQFDQSHADEHNKPAEQSWAQICQLLPDAIAQQATGTDHKASQADNGSQQRCGRNNKNTVKANCRSGRKDEGGCIDENHDPQNGVASSDGQQRLVAG